MQNKLLFLRKAPIFLAKSVLWIYIIYLFLALIIIPVIAPWLISSQATKLLKHPVKVRAVLLNPFLLRFNINGFSILDNHKQVMVGFDKFWVDFSFIGLFQKKYRIESVGLNGLQVNLQLLEDGSINLLSLVPKETVKPVEPKTVLGKSGPKKEAVQKLASTAAPAKPLPAVLVDLVSMDNGRVSFTDLSVKPNFVTALNAMKLRITGISTDPNAEAKVVFESKLDALGTISTETSIKLFAVPIAFNMVFRLNDYALGVLTPYVGKYTGHTVKDGKLSLSMNYRVADNQLYASHKILVQSFDFGDKVESKDALNLPFGLALAILEDSQNRIDIALPVTGDMSKPDFHYFQLIGQVLKNFFFKIITKPFSFLGSMMGAESGSEELSYIRFAPGQTELADTEKAKLNIVVKALKERPKLSLKVNGCYDPVVDWRAIKEDVFNQDYSILRKGSKRLDNWVYQELYQRRFGILDLWKLTKSYRSKEGVYDDAKINAEIKRQLIADGSANKVALSALATVRAKVIYDFIISAGFDAHRVSLGEVQEIQGNADFIPLELVLTVFDSALGLPADPAEVKK
jgi:Domain of Unknown Function (DUF748)